jgi:hypothetical protein
MNEEYLTAAEAADYLNLSVSRIYHLREKLSHKKCGNSKTSRVYFIKSKLLDDYLRI